MAIAGFSAVAYAQVPTTTTPQPAVTATQKPLTPAAKKVRLQEAVTGLERSLEVRIATLEEVAMRIQSRIAKLQLEGKDMTIASAKLVEAQKAITGAKTELATMKKANVAMVASTKPATAFANIKNKLAKNVTTKIKAAHKALVETIVSMKGAGNGMPATATTSTSTAR